jgi:DNA topoisomerase-1
MRTDSTRLATSFVKECGDYILAKYGPKYLGTVKNRNQKGMQDAHEGIRPTSIERTPDSIKNYLTEEEYKIYKLIYNRTLASLMSNAIFAQTTVEFTNTDSTWQTSGSELIFDGYLKVYGKSDEDKNSLLPVFNLNESYNALEINILDKETEPKKRYTEASLIKEMEKNGIGRPSTYATIIDKLKDENVVIKDKKFYPTEIGFEVNDKLQQSFSSIINVKYTSNMEDDLDIVADGKRIWYEVLKSFWDSFKPMYDKALKEVEKTAPTQTGDTCPECGSPLVYRTGRYGEFVACSNYPKCKYVQKEEKKVTEICDCPKCGHKIIEKRTKKGKVFYGCNNYPKCSYALWDKPTGEVCDNCGELLVEKNNKVHCPNCDK